ncbi:MAG: hypothetical protein AAFQ82_24875, partial [Myxococcota bacterium]
MALFTLSVGLVGPAFAASPSLAKAQESYRDQKYKRVLPLLKKALREDPSPREEVEIYELMAMTQVVFGRSSKARDAYVKVLELNPDYQVPTNASPKIRKAFRQAKKRAKKRSPTPRPPAPEPQPEPGAEDPPANFDPFDTGSPQQE